MACHAQCAFAPFTFASGTIVRISKIEIIGSTRMNRKNSVMNRPMRAEERHPVPARRP